MGILLLGPVVVEADGALSPRDRAVLAALAVRRGQVSSPDAIADAVWGERPPSTWPKQVQACVGRLRKALGATAIETTSSGYALAVDADELDLHRFEELVARARALAASGEPDRAASTFTRALGLWRGRPYAELSDWPPAVSESNRLGELRLSVEEDLLDARLACGEHREVAAAAESLVNGEPLRERRWELLALAQYRCGRQGDALRTLQRARRTLVEQLGIDPSRRLAALESAILDQDRSLDVAVGLAPVSEECPYKGLAAYDVDDHDSFFGRDAQVAACLERLRSGSLLVVTGASGCGKSSLARAGLAAALSRPDHAAIVIVPGSDLLAALAVADSNAALIVDQFEELFAIGVPVDAVRAVCAAIAARVERGSAVLLAIRADHLTGLVADPDLGKLAERSLHFVTPLAGNELRAAIEEPARIAGLRVEHGLVDLLVRDTEGEPGSLPLLSHALVETWRRRDGRVLTVEGYQASGGIRGAVARSADRLYESLPAEQRSMLRSLMLRLVAPSLEGDPVRCRVAASSLRGDIDRERIVALLVRARLLTSEADTIELAHEALARAWPRLRSWLDEDSAGQRILRHLAATAEGWEALGRPDAELYRGARLDTAIEYRDAAQPDLTTVETEFLDASQRHAAAERDALIARVRLDSRRNRRLRVLLGATALLLAGSLVAGLLAFRSRSEAHEQRDAAKAAEAEARLEALVNRSLALRSSDRDVAALLAVEAARRWPDDARATSALLGTFTAPAVRGFLGDRYVPGAHRLLGAVVPGKSTGVIAPDGGRLVMVDLATGRLEERFAPPPDDSDAGRALRVSADGRSVVQLTWSGAFTVYDVASGEVLVGPLRPTFAASDVAINADGSLIAIGGGNEGEAAVYGVADGREVGTLPGLPPPVDPPVYLQGITDTAAVAFGPDGLLYVGSLAGPIRVVDPGGVELVATLLAPRYSSNEHVAVGNDGIVIAGGRRALVAVDADSGRIRWMQDLRGTHPDPCPWFAVDEPTERLYCGNHFGTIEQRDRTTGLRIGVDLDPQHGRVGAIDLVDGGNELVTFGDSAPVISRWRLDGSGLITRMIADGHIVADGYDFVDGSTLLVAVRPPGATAWEDFTDFALWDVATDREIDPLIDSGGGTGWLGRNSISANGWGWYDVPTRGFIAAEGEPPAGMERFLPSAGGERGYLLTNTGDVFTVDAVTHTRIEPTVHVAGLPWWVSATRDGARIVVTALSNEDGHALTNVYDGSTGEQLAGPLDGPAVTSVSLNGVLVGASGGDITSYDLTTLEPLVELPGARGEVNTLQFSDDGATLLATSLDQTASVYDVATGTRLGDPIPSSAPFVYGAFLRHDGGAVAVTDRTGVAIWDLDADHLREAACTVAGRNLTAGEWETYLADLGPYRPSCPELA